jgi:predicted dehydrogenase
VLRGAFIGFGNVAASGHMPGWRSRDDVRIVAATDAAPSRRDAFLAACPDGRWHEKLDEMLLREQLDFVDICAPPGRHAALIGRALDAGFHVLSEKPLATRIDDAARLASAAARAGRVLHTVHNWLHAPICLKVSALIDEGAIGVVRSVRWRTLRTAPATAVGAPGSSANWRVDPKLAGGGILIDHGWHALYCVARWAGVPLSLSARLETRRFHGQPLEDTATLSLKTAAGVSEIFLTWAADERSNAIEIDGEQGEIRVAGGSVVLRSNLEALRWTSPSLAEGSHHPDWFGGVAADFLAAARGGGKGNLEEALLCARLVDAAQRSSAAGGAPLALSPQAPEEPEAPANSSRAARKTRRQK